MPVFRVEKNKYYPVMANFHLRDKSLSLKAKGLLSQMLSLPEDWDYTLSGLCYINRESKDAIRSAVNELERAGYIERHQTTDEGICTPFSPARFRVEGIRRMEYGEPGEYVVCGWHFSDAGTLKLELGLTFDR